MTSTKVLGSLNSQAMNLMNLTQPASKSSGLNFQDFISQTGSNLTKNEVKNPSDFKTDKPVKADVKPKEETPEVKTEAPKSEGIKAEVSAVKEERPVTEEEIDTVKEAVSSVFEALKEEFEVTDEDILLALENLGLTPVAVLDVTKLPEIVAEIEGAEDTLSIMTDENLYEKLSTVETKATVTVENLLASEKIDSEDFKEALKTVAKKAPEEIRPVLPKEAATTEKIAPEETKPLENKEEVTVRPLFSQEVTKKTEETDSDEKPVTLEDKISIRIDKTVTRHMTKIETRTNLNETDAEETEFKPITSDLKRSDFFDRSKDQGHKETPMNFVENLLNKTVQAMNETSEAISYTSFDVRNVMDQITEAIKVDVNSETSEINLRLHPETLGTVSVKVSANHEGVLTARFTAQNESVKAIIESQAIVLKETLESKGVTVEAVEVLVQSHEFERNLSDRGKREGNASDSQKKKGLRRIDLSLDEADTESSEDTLVREMMAQNGNTIDYSA